MTFIRPFILHFSRIDGNLNFTDIGEELFDRLNKVNDTDRW